MKLIEEIDKEIRICERAIEAARTGSRRAVRNAVCCGVHRGWICTASGGRNLMEEFDGVPELYEIIGNIHDNLELVRGA